MKISVSSSTFDSGIWNQLQNSPNLSEAKSSCVRSRVIPGLKNSRYQQDFLTLLFLQYWWFGLRFLAVTTAMISNPHVALNRERIGDIIDFLVVGSKTKQRTVSGKKVAKAKRGLKLIRKVEIEGISRKGKREGIVIKTGGQHSPTMKRRQK